MIRDAHDPTAVGRPEPSDRETGLPGLRSWKAVYVAVLGVFILWIGLLTWFTNHYTP
ncbi:MAG TPA: hypothetical protein VGM64_04435 [Lacunisphaera sp.]|jgi:hypothetical protein